MAPSRPTHRSSHLKITYERYNSSIGKRNKQVRGSTIGPKPRAKKGLSKTFKCVFCGIEDAVTVTINKKVKCASLNCRHCNQNWATAGVSGINAEHVDVYCAWIDACDAVAKQAAVGKKA